MFCFFLSSFVEIVEDLVCLLVSDYTLVCALHLVQENNVHVCLGTLAEARGHDESVEKVGI